MDASILIPIAGALLWPFLALLWTVLRPGAQQPDEHAELTEITSCARSDYDFSAKTCRKEPELYFKGEDLRNFHDEWEWDRMYSVHWAYPDPAWPLQLEWNVTDTTIAYIELSHSDTKFDFTFDDLLKEYFAKDGDGPSDEAPLRKTLKSHDSSLMVRQDDRPDTISMGPVFRLTDSALKSRYLPQGDKDLEGSSDASESGGCWNSKHVAVKLSRGPKGVEKMAFTGIVNMCPQPTGMAMSSSII